MNFIEAFNQYLIAGVPVAKVSKTKFTVYYKIINNVLYEKRVTEYEDESDVEWEESFDSITDLYSETFEKPSPHIFTPSDYKIVEACKHIGVLKTIVKIKIDDTYDQITMEFQNNQSVVLKVLTGEEFSLLEYDAIYRYDYVKDYMRKE